MGLPAVKIVVDIGHPAHVHLFKYFIWEMGKRGHEVLITATNKDVSLELLDNYGFDYIAMGSYGNSLMKKLINVPIMDCKMYKVVKGFKPDILVGAGSIRAAHVSKLIRKPCIVFDDTEHSKFEHILYRPFTDAILTPFCFNKDFGKKQIRYNGYHELAYLHPNYFRPDSSIYNELGISATEKYVVLRFNAFDAFHDIGKQGFSLADKHCLVRELEKHCRVFISDEGSLPQDLECYKLPIPYERIHHALYFAQLVVSDTQTLTAEAAILGTPAIRCNNFVGTNDMGNFIELEQKYGLIYCFRDSKKAIQKAVELASRPDLKQEWAIKSQRLLADKIDVTQFIASFIEDLAEGRY